MLKLFRLCPTEDMIEVMDAQPPFEVNADGVVNINGEVWLTEFETAKEQLIKRLVDARQRVQGHIDNARKLTRGAVIKLVAR